MDGNANGWQTTLGVGRGPSANPGWRQPNGLTRQVAFWLVAVSLVGVFLSGVPTAQASLQTQGPWPAYWYGVMSARNLVRGPNGERIFAEFGADGEVLREFGEATGPLAGAFVMSGTPTAPRSPPTTGSSPNAAAPTPKARSR